MYGLKEELNIENMIYEIRGKQVMLDSDLAKLYECKNGTKDINKAVKRNIERFPKNFYFQITEEEMKKLWFQSGTANKMIRSLPYVFTEQGIAMLSSVLHTQIAISQSIRIMDTFVKMRKIISSNLIEQKYINELVIKDNERINLLEESFSKLEEKEEIIIIDNYADKSILDMITNLNVKVTIVTRKFNLLKDIDIKKYNNQYHNLKVIYSDKFHDRFIIIDRTDLYHSGASYKDLGNKCFGINKIKDDEYLENILIKIGL